MKKICRGSGSQGAPPGRCGVVGGLDKGGGSFLSDPKDSESKATLTPLEPQGLRAAVPGHSGLAVMQTHSPGSPRSGGHTWAAEGLSHANGQPW